MFNDRQPQPAGQTVTLDTKHSQQQETVKLVQPTTPPKPDLRPQVSEEKSAGNTLTVSSWSQYESALESPNTSSLSTSGGRKVGAFTEYGNSAYTQVGDLRDHDTPINEQGLLEEEEDEWS